MKLFRGSIHSGPVRIAYQRTGGDLPPVLLIHGLTDNGMIWNSLVAELAFSYDVVFPDMRGHGYSSLTPDGDYRVAAMADDVVALVHELGITGSVIIGHSMGAAITAYLGGQFGDLFRGLVLIDPPWIDPASVTDASIADAYAAFETDLKAYRSLSYDELVANIRSRNPNWIEADYRAWAKAKQQASFDALAVIPSLARDWQEHSAKITLPALLVTGNPALGAIVSREIAEAQLKAHPNWIEYHSEISGHGVSRDDRLGTVKAIKRFLLDRFLEN